MVLLKVLIIDKIDDIEIHHRKPSGESGCKNYPS